MGRKEAQTVERVGLEGINQQAACAEWGMPLRGVGRSLSHVPDWSKHGPANPLRLPSSAGNLISVMCRTGGTGA